MYIYDTSFMQSLHRLVKCLYGSSTTSMLKNVGVKIQPKKNLTSISETKYNMLEVVLKE